MDVQVIEEEGRSQLEVTVRCAPGDERVGRIVRCLRAATGRLTGYESPTCSERRLIPLSQVALVEVEERRVLIRTVDGRALESPMRLFEVEAALQGTEFVRVSRQVIVNFDKVVAIRPEPNGRMVLELDGGQRAVVTRTYAQAIKEKIGAAS
jgi:DNA-binding LytR/AlgR family response regulator